MSASAHSPIPEPFARSARTLMQRAEELGQISEEQGRLTRRFATPAMNEANRLAEKWMRQAGMSVRRDNIGNLIGRYGQEGAGRKALLLGSHLDTVTDAGKYDGPLGVLAAIAAVEHLHRSEARLPFDIEVVAFSDEEGLRFHTSYLGSRVYAGCFDPALLERADQAGVSMTEAIREFGGDPDALSSDRCPFPDPLAYCEVHIEQGPVLEALDLPVGVVSAIAGQSRAAVTFLGEAGHAGTVPMQLRRDALCAAAEFVLAAEAVARQNEGSVATVGQLDARPGASNVIPGETRLSLDVRHIDDGVREVLYGALKQEASRIAQSRGVGMQWQALQDNPAVPCSSELSGLLEQAIRETGREPHSLPSGAGHDAVTMSMIAPIAMLFVRCGGGISHNPAEAVREDDVAVALQTLDNFIRLLAGQVAP